MTKRIPYLCGFRRFANAYIIQIKKEIYNDNKKLISLVLTLMMCLSLYVPSFASEVNTTSFEELPEMIGILTTDKGEQHIIKGTLVSSPPVNSKSWK